MKPVTTHILWLTTIAALSLDGALGGRAKPMAISPQDFTIKACKWASDVRACETTVSSVIASNPHDVELDASKIALETARRVQERFEEVALALNDLIEDSGRDAKLKAALSGCYRMYTGVAHEARMTTTHLKQKNEVCELAQGRLATSAAASPMFCEEALVQAGTTGEKLKLYKDYEDLQDLAAASDSVIDYLIRAHHFKTTNCKDN